MNYTPSSGHQINTLGRLYAKTLNERILSAGITVSQWGVINRLLIHGELTQTEIFQQLLFKASSVSKTLDGMEKMGWIKRRVAESDKREKKVALTDKTKKHVKKWIQISRDFEKQVLADIPAEDFDVFRRVLDRIFLNLKTIQE